MKRHRQGLGIPAWLRPAGITSILLSLIVMLDVLQELPPVTRQIDVSPAGNPLLQNPITHPTVNRIVHWLHGERWIVCSREPPECPARRQRGRMRYKPCSERAECSFWLTVLGGLTLASGKIFSIPMLPQGLLVLFAKARNQAIAVAPEHVTLIVREPPAGRTGVQRRGRSACDAEFTLVASRSPTLNAFVMPNDDVDPSEYALTTTFALALDAVGAFHFNDRGK